MVRIIMLLLIWCMPLHSVNSDSSGDWTWVHRKNFDEKVRVGNVNKKSLLFCQENVKPFTQLVFSWNAIRPEKGHFSFYVQVRDAHTKKWRTWHHMVDWGNNIQQSYVSKSDGFSSYIHVRLEIEDKKHADAFRIKVEPQKSASLSLIHSFSVALSDFTIFKAESHKNIDNSLQSVHVIGMPSIAQFALDHEDNSRICSPTSCAMLVDFLIGHTTDPLDFAAKAFDSGLNVYGSWPCNMAHAFEVCGGKFNFFVRRMNAFADLHQQLVQGMPVIVSVRGTLPGALKPFPHGHLMVVVGWDSESRDVLCHDPACESDTEVFKRYPLIDFLRAWECSHRLSYVVEPIGLFSVNKN
ncbi:MAG TPA: C39 family peptidase [Candidatus Babeliales bacterium]|nr:C39 family peptidase [Candidatus Babeliales bacterium]